MFRTPKTVLSFGTGAVALGFVILASPRAVHAVVATLVQVTNTTANPVVAQNVNTQASQLVELSVQLFYPHVGFVPLYLVNGTGLTPNYVVPANQNLVITAVDLSPIGSCPNPLWTQLAAPAQLKVWWVPAGGTSHFAYPSGIVLGPGSTPEAFGLNIVNDTCSLLFDMHGYLTSN
jgi:hypothetical protein